MIILILFPRSIIVQSAEENWRCSMIIAKHCRIIRIAIVEQKWFKQDQAEN